MRWAIVATALLCLPVPALGEDHGGDKTPLRAKPLKDTPVSLTDYLKLPDSETARDSRNAKAQRTERARLALTFLLEWVGKKHVTETAKEEAYRRELLTQLQENPAFIEWNDGDVVDEKPQLVMTSRKPSRLKLNAKTFDTSLLAAPNDFLELLQVSGPKAKPAQPMAEDFKIWVESPANRTRVKDLTWYAPSTAELLNDALRQLSQNSSSSEDDALKKLLEDAQRGFAQAHDPRKPPERDSEPFPPPPQPPPQPAPWPPSGTTSRPDGVGGARRPTQPQAPSGQRIPLGGLRGAPFRPNPRAVPNFTLDDLVLGEDPSYEQVERADKALYQMQSQLSPGERTATYQRIERARAGKRYTLSFLPTDVKEKLSDTQLTEASKALGSLFVLHEEPMAKSWGRLVELLGAEEARKLFVEPKFKQLFDEAHYLALRLAFEKKLDLPAADDGTVYATAMGEFQANRHRRANFDDLTPLARRYLQTDLPSLPPAMATADTAYHLADARQTFFRSTEQMKAFDELFARMTPESIEKDLLKTNALKLSADGEKYLKLRYELFRKGLHVVALRNALKENPDDTVRLDSKLTEGMQRALGPDWKKELGVDQAIKGRELLVHEARDSKAYLVGPPPTVDRRKLLAALNRPEIAARLAPSETLPDRVWKQK